VIASVRSNLPGLVRRWERRTTEDLRRYVRSWPAVEARAVASGIRKRREPVWLLLPEWLAIAYRLDGRRRAADRRFLQDVLWGQFSVFLATKIQDDLFDGQIADRHLLWVADEFLLEAQRVFSLHFTGSKQFWDFYIQAIRATAGAIDLVDRHQSGRRPVYRTIARLYPSMYAVCKIATRAVCLRAGKPEHFQKASEFLDELALTGQLLDDLEDIGEDLGQGKVNAAAAFLLGGVRPGRNPKPAEIGRAMLETDCLQRFFQMLQRHLRQAEKIVRFLKHPELTRYLQSYGGSLKASEAYFGGLKAGCVTGEHPRRRYRKRGHSV
jgi:hypothetical protein